MHGANQRRRCAGSARSRNGQALVMRRHYLMYRPDLDISRAEMHIALIDEKVAR